MRPKDKDKCDNCLELAEDQKRWEEGYTQKVLNRLDDYLKAVFLNNGMSPREVKATMERVPQKIKSAIPKATLEQLFSGEIPLNGFGLGGTTGGGKTMAIAAILKACGASQAKNHKVKPHHPFGGPLRGMVWASWPDEVSWLRSNAISPDAPIRVKELAQAELLILDDLGRERIKGNYSDDWAASQLDTVINHRYRGELPTIWTTNVTEMDLVNLYGAAMLRRLTADNPLIWIPDLKVMG
jgi:hypothetical protein